MAQPGLSICLPVFNYEAAPLLADLLDCMQQWPDVEILVYEDGPESKTIAKNQKAVQALVKAAAPIPVIYKALPQNLGRSQIRNQLAADASHNWLLFIDIDSRLPSTDFLENYREASSQGQVVVGGTLYTEELPPVQQRLRWLYGLRRELRPLHLRSKHPFESLALNNVLVQRAVLLAHPIPQLPLGYGHEDTLWGESLRGAGISIYHIDNPVQHVGLESAEDFVRKTIMATQNFAVLLAQGHGQNTRLAQAYYKARKLGMARFHRGLFKLALRLIAFPLTAVRGLDLLKLAVLLGESRAGEKRS